MITVVALGNPGDRYRHTPHNAGWIIADKIVPNDMWRYEKYAQADIAEYRDVRWVKPKTYMNNSGEVLLFLKKQHELSGHTLVVLHDDLDVTFGQLKVSHNRGDGGHNGIKSLALHFGSLAFTRIRLGIAPEDNRVAGFDRYVLSALSPSQLSELHDLVPLVERVITTIAENGFEMAMNKYNSRKPHGLT